uniref:UBC core domain-containing protein n=1 Tax=viral metagenome TaxID=1070528 RepID=A0A6C0E9G8_9ZZZZ
MVKFNELSPETQKRLCGELNTIKRTKDDYYQIIQDENDVLKFYFMLRIKNEKAYEGGLYIGQIDLPLKFPASAPVFRVLTPSGRFKPNSTICTTASHYHQESWNVSWSLVKQVIGLLSIWLDDSENGISHIHESLENKINHAKNSHQFNMNNYKNITLRFDQFVNPDGTQKTNEQIDKYFKENCRPIPKQEQKVEVKETQNSSPKETSKAEIKETPDVAVKETPKTTVKETPKTTVKETPKTTVKETPKTTVKETPKAIVKETQKLSNESTNNIKKLFAKKQTTDFEVCREAYKLCVSDKSLQKNLKKLHRYTIDTYDINRIKKINNIFEKRDLQASDRLALYDALNKKNKKNNIVNNIVDDDANDDADDDADDVVNDDANDVVNDYANDVVNDYANDDANDGANDNANDVINDDANDDANDGANDDANDNANDVVVNKQKELLNKLKEITLESYNVQVIEQLTEKLLEC